MLNGMNCLNCWMMENRFTRHCRERRRKPKCQRSVNHFIIWLIYLFFFTLLFDWLIDWFIWFIWLFDLFQCLLKCLNYHLISIYLCGFYPDHAIISHVVVIGDSFNIYLSTIKKNVWPGIYEWNNENFSLNMKLKVKT